MPKYKLKQLNSDFIVKEIPFIPGITPSKTGQFTIMKVQKEGISTFALIDILARIINVDPKKIVASGLKDENAITQQLLSVEKILTRNDIEKINEKLTKRSHQIKIVNLEGSSQEPIQQTILHGNEFIITIRNLTSKTLNAIVNFIETSKFVSFINYYDEQRFGTPGSIHNTHLIGKALLSKNWKLACKLYLSSGNDPKEKAVVSKYIKSKKDYLSAALSIPENKRTFFISANNSWIWNERASREVKQKVKYAKLVNFPYLGELYYPVTNNYALSNLLSTKIEEIDWDKLSTFSRYKSRPLTATTSIYITGKGNDELNKGKNSLTLAFILPTGCYATMLIKQMLLHTIAP